MRFRTPNPRMRTPIRLLFLIVAAGLVSAVSGCNRPSVSRGAMTTPGGAGGPAVAHLPSTRSETAVARDLSVDESMGGHTLARHVGKTDAELAQRLRREPQISSASTYTDRATAERAVGAALAFSSGKVAGWQNRSGRRPNLVLHYGDRSRQPLGRSLVRGQEAAVPCDRVLVVLRWDERSGRFYVLTSYPEAQQ
jgi:hypothetical protein